MSKFMMEKEIIVYGYGRIGKELINKIENRDIKVSYVWDRNYENLGGRAEKPNFEYEDKDVLIIIALNSAQNCRTIKDTLRSYGFNNVVSSSDDVIRELTCDIYPKFDRRKCNKCLIDCGGCRAYKNNINKNSSNNIEFEQLSLTITTRCTLRCKDCCRYTNLYNNNTHKDFTYEDFKKYWDKFIYSVDYIYKLGVAGGELFLNKDLKSILGHLIKSDKIGVIFLTTNGTTNLIDKELIEILKEEKIHVLFDSYGDNLSTKMIEKNNRFLNQLEENDINYSLLDNSNGTWYDHGDFSNRGRSSEELENIYESCWRNKCFEITPNYEFVICGRQSTMRDLNISSEYIDNVDLKSNTKEEIGKKVKELMGKTYLETCNYCNGSSDKYLVKAGVQDN